MLNLVLFSGSSRQGNYTHYVAEFVKSVVDQRPDVHCDLVSPQSVGIDFQDEGNAQIRFPELRALVKQADGFIAVGPEYNHGYSASLKYLMDLNLKEYIHKPVSFVGVSDGPWGGTRMIEALVGSVREMGLVATFTDVNFSMVADEIDNGVVKDPAKWTRRVNRMLDELLWMTNVLKVGREQVPTA